MADVIGRLNKPTVTGKVSSVAVKGKVAAKAIKGVVSTNVVTGEARRGKIVAAITNKFIKAIVTEVVLRDYQIISEEEMAYAKRVDVINDNLYYNGEAVAGTLDGAPKWRIKRTTITGDDVVTEFASGTDKFDKVWDFRLTYNYS